MDYVTIMWWSSDADFPWKISVIPGPGLLRVFDLLAEQVPGCFLEDRHENSYSNIKGDMVIWWYGDMEWTIRCDFFLILYGNGDMVINHGISFCDLRKGYLMTWWWCIAHTIIELGCVWELCIPYTLQMVIFSWAKWWWSQLDRMGYSILTRTHILLDSIFLRIARIINLKR